METVGNKTVVILSIIDILLSRHKWQIASAGSKKILVSIVIIIVIPVMSIHLGNRCRSDSGHGRNTCCSWSVMKSWAENDDDPIVLLSVFRLAGGNI